MNQVRSLAAGAVGIALALGAVYAVGLATPATPPTIQGDTLGREPGESWGEYEGRAGASLRNSSDPAYALVVFREPVGAEQAARAVAHSARVSGLLLIDAPVQPLPEPAGATRAEVFAREAERAAAGAAKNGAEVDPERIVALVVRDDGDTLRAVAEQPDVRAVEVLPPDAVWGAFSVSGV